MTTTPEQIAQLISGYTELKEYFESVRNEVESDRQNLKEQVNGFIDNAAAAFPVTPNLLVDTKKFTKFCDGAVDTEVEAITAHGSPWSAFLYNGTEGNGTIKVVSLGKLRDEGIPYGGDLSLVTNGDMVERPFYGSDFQVLLLDITITKDETDGTPGSFFVMCQGCPRGFGWNKPAQILTQASVLCNVVEHTGDIVFYPHANMPASVKFGKDDLGAGWLYRHSIRRGFGVAISPGFQVLDE